MNRDEYIENIEEGLIAIRFERVPPNEIFGLQTETTFLGFTLSENKGTKRTLSNYTLYTRYEERASPQDNIQEYIVIRNTEIDTPENREDPDKSPVAVIRNASSWIKENLESRKIKHGTKIFVHVLFVTDEGTENLKKAAKYNAGSEYPNYGILPVLADVGNETLTYNTESMGARGLVGTPYMEQLNERAEEYFSVSE